MILFSAEASLASSTWKFDIEIPRINDEVFKFIHWINKLHFFDPLHRFRRKLRISTYLGLEPYLPASKGCWCKEIVKVKIRNLQSLLVCPIILWRVSSTEDDWIYGWRSRLASQISILFWSFPCLRRGDTKECLNIPPSIGWGGKNIGRLVTWEFPLRTDSASWKSLESFIQFTSFCSSQNLPDNSKIVFWSSMSFRLAIVSKIEL